MSLQARLLKDPHSQHSTLKRHSSKLSIFINKMTFSSRTAPFPEWPPAVVYYPECGSLAGSLDCNFRIIRTHALVVSKRYFVILVSNPTTSSLPFREEVGIMNPDAPLNFGEDGVNKAFSLSRNKIESLKPFNERSEENESLQKINT